MAAVSTGWKASFTGSGCPLRSMDWQLLLAVVGVLVAIVVAIATIKSANERSVSELAKELRQTVNDEAARIEKQSIERSKHMAKTFRLKLRRLKDRVERMEK